MTTTTRTFFIFLLLPLVLSGQKEQPTYTLSGYVRDAATGEDMIGVNILLPQNKAGTSTNNYGFYSLTVPADTYKVQVKYIGYQTKTFEINLNRDITKNIELSESSTKLQEVNVTGEAADQNVSSVEMSVVDLDAREIEKVPQLLGETDIIRTLTLLPGVSTAGEGSGGLNVRGGKTDQNLILLDEAPVYNSSHLFGFFSIFNADAVKDVKLYKGGIPAKYGGRLSSVVDVRQKEGNSKEFHSTGGIGLLSSKALVEGPIVKDKVSYMVAGRRSYADLFLGLADNPDISNSTLYFYDLNAKINYRISKKDRIYLSGYFGRDVMGIADLFNFDWGNTTASLRWNHLFSDKLFSNTTLIYSDYTYSLGTPEDDPLTFNLTSSIRNYDFKSQFDYFINSDNKIHFGIEGIFYHFRPGQVTGIREVEIPPQYAIEPAAYLSHDLKLGTRLKVKYGLRYSSFYKIGPQKVLNYRDPDFPGEEGILDTTSYQSGELIKSFDGLQGLEPRISVNYRLDDEKSLKASYNRTRQYIHLISNTTSPTPVDVYRPAGKYIKPSTVNQYALGYFQNFKQNEYEASLEVYYKDFNDLVDYRDGAQLIFNKYIETELLTGIGRSYGLEFLLRKQKGKLTGWLSYTLSRTERKVDNASPQDAISGGNWYPANYDKTHDISLTLNYKINEYWNVSGNFVFQTGRPVTPPEARFEYENFVVPVYRKRNSLRIPNYHRLDLSASYTPERDTSKEFYSTWSFGIYNVYARRNPYSLYFEQGGPANTGQNFNTNARRLSIFATAIPFVTWNFNF